MALTFPTPTKDDLHDAEKRLTGIINYTPLIESQSLNQMFHAQLYFKCENFQETGSFKARGAMNSCLNLLERIPSAASVATHSSGNHGRALAWAAKQLGLKAIIAVPENASELKIKAIEALGAEVHLCGPSQNDRELALEKIVNKTKAHFIPPFEYFDVICGQSTCVQEVLKQKIDLDLVLCPVGGGGLAAGSSLALKYFGYPTKLILSEPQNADDTYQSLKSGIHCKHNGLPDTIADGLRTNVGSANLEILRRGQHPIYTCSEENILKAMKMIWELLDVQCEPSSAVPLAICIEHPEIIKNKKAALIITGGNVSPDFWA